MESKGFTQSVAAHFLVDDTSSIAGQDFIKAVETYSANADIDELICGWQKRIEQIELGYVHSGCRQVLRWMIKRIQDQTWMENHFESRKNPNGPLNQKAVLFVESDRPEVVVYKPSAKMTLVFRDDMDKETAEAFCRLIRDMCSGGRSELTLIKNAVRANVQTPWLTKQEAFKLGHLLGFDANEMRDYLSRVFQDGIDADGTGNSSRFSPKSSNDLIELFTFLYPEQDPDELRHCFDERKNAIGMPETEKAQTPEDVTRTLYQSFMQSTEEWEVEGLSSEERKQAFLAWLLNYRVFLDKPSESGTELVRLLAIKALQVLEYYNFLEIPAPAPERFPCKEVSQIQKWLPGLNEIPYEEGGRLNLIKLPAEIEDDRNYKLTEDWTLEDWAAIAKILWYYINKVEADHLFTFCDEGKSDRLLHDYFAFTLNLRRDPKNQIFTDYKEFEHKSPNLMELGDYNVAEPQAREAGYGFPVPASQTGSLILDSNKRNQPGDSEYTGNSRLKNILSGAVRPQKNDVLFLLLFIASVKWSADDTRGVLESGTAKLREFAAESSEFVQMASDVLRADKYPALGQFYLPHFTEYMMHSAIMFSVITEYYHNPMSIYRALITSKTD